MINFLSGIICISLHWRRKLTLVTLFYFKSRVKVFLLAIHFLRLQLNWHPIFHLHLFVFWTQFCHESWLIGLAKIQNYSVELENLKLEKLRLLLEYRASRTNNGQLISKANSKLFIWSFEPNNQPFFLYFCQSL